MADIDDMSSKVRQKRWNWLGHIIRRDGGNEHWVRHQKVEEKEEDQRLPVLGQELVEKEKNKVGWMSWEVAKAVTRNRECWSESVTALCAYWCDEI